MSLCGLASEFAARTLSRDFNYCYIVPLDSNYGMHIKIMILRSCDKYHINPF